MVGLVGVGLGRSQMFHRDCSGERAGGGTSRVVAAKAAMVMAKTIGPAKKKERVWGSAFSSLPPFLKSSPPFVLWLPKQALGRGKQVLGVGGWVKLVSRPRVVQLLTATIRGRGRSLCVGAQVYWVKLEEEVRRARHGKS